MSKPNDFTKQRARIPEQGNTIFNCLNNFTRMRSIRDETNKKG